jgi:hypothetical protein
MTIHLQQTAENEFHGKLVKFRSRAHGWRLPVVGSERKVSENHPLYRAKLLEAIRSGRPFIHPVEYDYVLFNDVRNFTYFVVSVLVKSEGQNPQVSLDIYSNETALIRYNVLWMELDRTLEILDEEITKEQGSIYDIAERHRRNGY